MDGLTDKPATAEVELPAGYEDVESFLKEARERFTEGESADQENREAALDDLKFLTGESQWDPTVKAARQRRGRPCLVINDLPQFIGQVIGDTRTNRPSIKVRPVEDADQQLADIRAGLIRSIENLSNATQVYALAGEDQVSCGIGHFRIGLEYTNDDAFDQDIRIRHIPNPFAVVWDPHSTDQTGADANFVFVVDQVDKKSFKAAYPDAITSELTVATGASEWCTADGVRVTEYWLMQSVARTIALVQETPEAAPMVVDITGREKEMAEFVVTGDDGRPRVREVQRREAWMYLITGAEVLDGPYKLPISRVPIFKVTGREIRVADRRYRFGLIRFAKDPMRMKNVWRSSAAEWLAMSPKQQWLAHAANPEDATTLRNAHRSGDTVLTYTGVNPPTRLDPPSPPVALLQEAQLSAQDIKDVTGLHDASLGMKSNETSGKAIIARERQGDVATFMYHDNLNHAVRECGRVADELIPVAYDTPRTLRILGEDEASKIMRVNDPKAEGGLVDITRGKYDIYIDTGPSYATKRLETADSMTAALQAMPKLGEVAADLYVKAQDWPDADVLAKRLKKAMPPEIVNDDDDEPTPEQAQAKAQAEQMAAQQAQMQQQAAQMAQEQAKLALEEQRAKTRQAVAQADKAVADAEKAKAEAQRAILAPIVSGPTVSPPSDFPPTGEGSPAAF